MRDPEGESGELVVGGQQLSLDGAKVREKGTQLHFAPLDPLISIEAGVNQPSRLPLVPHAYEAVEKGRAIRRTPRNVRIAIE